MRNVAIALTLALTFVGCTVLNDPGALSPDPDSTPPGTPASVTTSIGSSDVTLTWSPVTDWDFDHYEVFFGTDPTDMTSAGTTTETQLVVSELTGDVTYYFEVVAVDSSGNVSLASEPVSATPDGTAPTVAFSPTDGATGENINIDIVLTFSEPMVTDTVESAVTFACTAGCASAPTCAWSWASDDTVAICTFAQDLQYASTYSVAVSTAATDLVGNELESAQSAVFHTTDAPDTTPPTVVSTTPAQSSTGNDVATTIAVEFSEAMNESQTQTAFQLLTVAGSDAAAYRNGTWSWSADHRILTYDPPIDLPHGALVTFSIGSGACDTAPTPNCLQSVYDGSFRIAYEKTVVIYSDGPLDGYSSSNDAGTSASVNTTGSYLYVGDSSSNYHYRAFMSFAHTLLTPAPQRIVSATFSVYQTGCTGAPYDDLDTVSLLYCPKYFDCDTDLLARHVDYGDTLTAADIDAAYIASIGEITETTTVEWKTRSVTARVADDVDNGRTHTQVRLEFPVTTDNDSSSDYCWFYSGDYATTTLRPKLEVTFEYP